jgi:type III pantothenate kinase
MTDTSQGHLLAVAVGNTRTRFGLFHGNDLSDPESLPNTDVAAIATAVIKAAEGEHGVSIVISDVNPKVADALQRALVDAGEENVFRIGADIEIPMEHTLEDVSTVGQDRLLCAFGAHARAGQACVVVDAGTAVTVDFVDGDGAFHGGVIAPGLNMMLQAMHEKTAKLPLLTYQTPELGGTLTIGEARRIEGDVVDDGPTTPHVLNPFGKDTKSAMLLGVTNCVRGLVLHTVEKYAEFFGAYPQVVATGGDAAALFGEEVAEGGGVVESIVPDLQLIGILEVCRAVEEMRASGME